jgi:hypothetical protein
MMDIKPEDYNRLDPDPWHALYFDQSVPMDWEAKKALVFTSRSKSRQFLLPILRPFMKLLMAVFQIFRTIFPKWPHSSQVLHRLIVWGMKTFVQPEANLLILRHFHLGTQVLQFLCRNIEGMNLKTDPLLPMKIEDLADNFFVKHDINLYNFVYDMNRERSIKGLNFAPIKPLDFSMIQVPNLSVQNFHRSWTHVIDLETAIECYTPFFQLFLTDRDFWRATQSLQLDETIGIYFAQLLNRADRLFMVNNKHPLVPQPTWEAGHRLVLHGISTEMLHALLLDMKKSSAALPGKDFRSAFLPSR